MMSHLSAFTIVTLFLLGLVLGTHQEAVEAKQEQPQPSIQDAYAQVVYCEVLENEAIVAADSSWTEIYYTVPLATEEGAEKMGDHAELLARLDDARIANRAAVARFTALLEREGLIEFGLTEGLDPERCESRRGGPRPARLLRPPPR